MFRDQIPKSITCLYNNSEHTETEIKNIVLLKLFEENKNVRYTLKKHIFASFTNVTEISIRICN